MNRASLLLLTLLMSVNVWGTEKTYKFTPDAATSGSSATAYVTSAYSFTYDEIGWSFNQWNPSSLQIKTNQSSAGSEFNFKNTSAFPGKIKSVVITFNALTVSDASKLCFVGGTSAISSLSGGSAGTWNSTAKTLTWTPAAGTSYTYFAFYQNGKAASGTNNLASSDAIVITYEEEPATYTVSFAVNPAGYGTVSQASLKDVEDGTSISASGSTLTIGNTTITATPTTATAQYTYTFNNWTWSPTGSTITAATTATANFNRTENCTKEITITKGTPSNGSFSLSQTGTVCIDDGNATVSVTNISPATHYHFLQITATSGLVDNTNKQVTNISANTTINVEFEEDPKYTITFLDGVHSTDCSSWNMNSYAGTQIVFPSITDKTAAAPMGDCVTDHYHFVGWVEENTTPTQSPSNVITAGTTSINITKNVTYKAVWAKEE